MAPDEIIRYYETLGGNYPATFEVDHPARLMKSPDDVASMPWAERENRVAELTKWSERIIEIGKEVAEKFDGARRVVATVGLVSGGMDSTTMAYLIRPWLTHLVFADTGIGIATTREFIRSIPTRLDIPLIEVQAPRPVDHYSHLVRERGFPGPAMHAKFYTRLKERAFMEARNKLIQYRGHDRVLFVAGRRRSESKRRALIPDLERRGSVVYVSPMVLWTKPDLNTYRKMCEVPVNPVYEMLHISGECLCGCFAQKGEREWTLTAYPDDPSIKLIRSLETELRDRADIPDNRKLWGCGGDHSSCPSGLCNE